MFHWIFFEKIEGYEQSPFDTHYSYTTDLNNLPALDTEQDDDEIRDEITAGIIVGS